MTEFEKIMRSGERVTLYEALALGLTVQNIRGLPLVACEYMTGTTTIYSTGPIDMKSLQSRYYKDGVSFQDDGKADWEVLS
jgi:hypothetical protein